MSWNILKMPLRIMKMNELLKRAFFGLIFLIVFWAAFSLGFFSWVIFVLTLLVIGLFEFYKILNNLCVWLYPSERSKPFIKTT